MGWWAVGLKRVGLGKVWWVEMLDFSLLGFLFF